MIYQSKDNSISSGTAASVVSDSITHLVNSSFAARVLVDPEHGARSLYVAALNARDRATYAITPLKIAFVQWGNGSAALIVLEDTGRLIACASRNPKEWTVHGKDSRSAVENLDAFAVLLGSPKSISEPYSPSFLRPRDLLRKLSFALGVAGVTVDSVQLAQLPELSDALGSAVDVAVSRHLRKRSISGYSPDLSDIQGIRTDLQARYAAGLSLRWSSGEYAASNPALLPVNVWMASTINNWLGERFPMPQTPGSELAQFPVGAEEDLLLYMRAVIRPHIPDPHFWTFCVRTLATDRPGSPVVTLELFRVSFLDGNVEETAIALFSLLHYVAGNGGTAVPAWRAGLNDEPNLFWTQLVMTFDTLMMSFVPNEQTGDAETFVSDVSSRVRSLLGARGISFETASVARSALCRLFIDVADANIGSNFPSYVLAHPQHALDTDSDRSTAITDRLRRIALLADGVTPETASRMRKLISKTVADGQELMTPEQKYLLRACWLICGGDLMSELMDDPIHGGEDSPEFFLFHAETVRVELREGESGRPVTEILEAGLALNPGNRLLLNRLQAQLYDQGRIHDVRRVAEQEVRYALDTALMGDSTGAPFVQLAALVPDRDFELDARNRKFDLEA